VTRAYYNEIDAYAAQWLRNLIREGLIADGDVDTRSIADVRPVDLAGYTQCHFFAGLGGWSGALRLSGVWPDRRAIWTGSCPCQPFSLAGKQGGFADERHLWPHWQYLIEQCSPAVILGEQVASASDWLRLVRSDLEALGYAVGAIPVEAASAGADHLRDRYWFVANADDAGSQGRRVLPERAGERIAGPDGMVDAVRSTIRIEPRRRGGSCGADTWEHRDDSEGSLPDAVGEQAGTAGQPRERERLEWVYGADGKARRVKSGIRLLAHGVPARVAKLRAFGNAIDLRPAAKFIQAVHESI
jgi:DNA (cytosine-5)-methyltransferase 1